MLEPGPLCTGPDFYADALQDLTLRSIVGGGGGLDVIKAPKPDI